MTEITAVDSRAELRTKIVDVAAELLRDQGEAAVTTRGVAEAAGIQAPTIYRLFGDKDGLLEAVAEHVMTTFVSEKAAHVEAASADNVDPLDDLRAGWNSQIEFGVANPALFRLLSEPGRVLVSAAAQSGRRVLESRVRRVAETGRLGVSEDRAVGMIQAAGIGTIQVLLTTPPQLRDSGLADSMYDAVLGRMLVDPPAHGSGSAGGGSSGDAGEARGAGRARGARGADRGLAASVAFRAIVPRLTVLSEAERGLVGEWLDRVIADGS